ncbi:MAG: 2-oxo acid dehydrogenase subunit E2 [Leptospirales bacterium]|jgi:pyruvate dehydrogenase E2 component (dihydrolipoamide acetyltransferase)
MAVIIELTQLSPTMEEGTFVKWVKNKGDAVEPGEVLAEVETDKAVMELEAYDEGILLVQLAEQGDRLPVGAPIGIVGEAGEEVSDLIDEAKQKLQSAKSGSGGESSADDDASSKSEARGSDSSAQSNGDSDDSDRGGGEKQSDAGGSDSASKKQQTQVAEAGDEHPERPIPTERKNSQRGVDNKSIHRSGRILASPLARRIAHEHGVELSRVKGTGPGDRITKSDVKEYMRLMNGMGAGSAAGAGLAPTRPDKKVEISGMRKVIAERLHDAKNNIPHFYLTLEFDAEPMVQMRSKLNDDLKATHTDEDEKPPRVSYNDLIVKACALTLAKHPTCNSSWRGDHMLQHGRIDVGIAVAIDGGLITPYVRNADQLPLLQLAAKINELGKRARDRKLKQEEYTDGTFTTSNLGMFGVSNFSAIINEPEAALMAIGGLIEKAVVRNGELVAGKTMTVVLSCDHRVIDGAEGARFLQTFQNYMEHPHLLLL